MDRATGVLVIIRSALSIAVLGSAVSAAGAQVTSYGEDPVPASHEGFERWRPYGSDPVPSTRFAEHGYVQAYGMDPVPGQPLNDFTAPFVPSTLPDTILPEQSLEVLTRER